MRPLTLDRIRHAVLVAPHADDETIAAFFTISALRRRGARVDIVVVTDSSASHRNSAAYPKAKLIDLRKAETLSAMLLAGVARQHITFLGLPDGGLRDLTAVEVRHLVRSLRARPRPDLLVVPSAHDDHPDHREVAAWCDHAWPVSVPRLSYLVWPSQRSRSKSPRSAMGVFGNPASKRTALRRYRSQLGLIRDDPTGFCLTADVVRRVCNRCERFAC